MKSFEADLSLEGSERLIISSLQVFPKVNDFIDIIFSENGSILACRLKDFLYFWQSAVIL